MILNISGYQSEIGWQLSHTLRYILIFIFGFLSLLIAFDGHDILTSLSGAAATLANVGPGLNETIGPSGNYAGISDVTKLFMCLGMLIGRLELFPVLILLSPQLWKR